MSQGDSITITRTFNATRAQVWYACSSANMLRFWWGLPRGATMPYIELDFKVGGSLYFRIEPESGDIMWGHAFYKEIVPLERIVVENHFSNEKGELLDSTELPLSSITLTISDAPTGTRLTILHEHLSDARSTGAVHTLEQYRKEWAESLERLALELVNQ